MSQGPATIVGKATTKALLAADQLMLQELHEDGSIPKLSNSHQAFLRVPYEVHSLTNPQPLV